MDMIVMFYDLPFYDIMITKHDPILWNQEIHFRKNRNLLQFSSQRLPQRSPICMIFLVAVDEFDTRVQILSFIFLSNTTDVPKIKFD